MKLDSELALLLVARGESHVVLLFEDPDPTLDTEESEMFVTTGLRLPGMLRLISCSKRQVSISTRFATAL